ncbi:MAG: hypothetical protein AAF371_10935 [Pseudomonadota bacterium]
MEEAPIIGIVCGLESERRALGLSADDGTGVGVSVAVSGARPAVAEAAARQMVDRGARVLASWGLAGGLDMRHATGDVVLPREVVGEGGGRWPMAEPPVNAPVPGARPPRLVGLEGVVFGPAEKKSLAVAAGASVADMESHRVATVGAEMGVPVIVVRAVSDNAGRALPQLAADAVGADGRPRIGKVLLGLLRRPTDLPALLRAGRDSAAAHAALSATAPAFLAALRAMAAR